MPGLIEPTSEFAKHDRVGPPDPAAAAVTAAMLSERLDTAFRRITMFRRSGRHYRRSEETHIIRLYERAHVLDALRAAGFSARTARGWDGEAMLPGRTVFVARAR
jgi:hypothetical protein